MDYPIILYESKNTKKDLEHLISSNKIWKTTDLYKKQLIELFDIENPQLLNSKIYKKSLNAFLGKKMARKHSGNWIYFPWNGNLIRILGEPEYYKLRTNRNRNLITSQEQKKLQKFCVGIVGLSVGNNIAVGLAQQGVGKIKICEMDSLETTNLNRIRTGFSNIGSPKIELTAEEIYEIDPYTHLTLFEKGLDEKNINGFLDSDSNPKLIFEIIDNFEMKIRLRLKARKMGIPVIMLANVHDKVIADVERYDINNKTEILNGLVGDLPEHILENPKSNPNKYAVDIVGKENVSKRALQSVKEIGKTLVGRPQLTSTVTISSGLAIYFTRKIALGETLKSGRYVFSLDKFII